MEQILIIQPTTSQLPPSSSGPQDVQNDFSPHLNAAIKDQKNSEVNVLNSNSSGSQDVQNDVSPHLDAVIKDQKISEVANHTLNVQEPTLTESSVAHKTTTLESSKSSDSFTIKSDDQPFGDSLLDSLPIKNDGLLEEVIELNTVSTEVTVAATFQFAPNVVQDISRNADKNVQQKSVSDLLLAASDLENNAFSASSKTNSQGNGTIQSQISSTIESLLQQQSSNDNTPPIAGQFNGQNSKVEQDKILTQLQQIIDNSSEKGKVTISQTNKLANSYTTNNITNHPGYQTNVQQQFIADAGVETSTASLTISTILGPDELPLNISANKQNQDLTGLRLDTKQQFYDAKLGEQSNNSQTGTNSPEDGSTTNQFGQQAGSSQNLGASTTNADQPNTFAQIAAGTQGLDTQTVTETVRPVIPLAHNLAHEQEVLQQLVDKFQINVRKPDTNLNIKLHPAELGELKIDLTVKEGSIRANVLAQSQHVQEILEKNMLKLKTVLEDQGFTVEEITVTSESDSVGDFDLFENHLFNQQDNTAATKNNSNKSVSGFLLDEDDPIETPTVSGVNVTA